MAATLSPQQVLVLRVLREHGGALDTQSLAAFCKTTAQGLRGQLSRLHKDKYVKSTKPAGTTQSIWQLVDESIFAEGAAKLQNQQASIDDARFDIINKLEHIPAPKFPISVFDLLWHQFCRGVDLAMERAVRVDWDWVLRTAPEAAHYIGSHPRLFFTTFRELALKRGHITEAEFGLGTPFVSVHGVPEHRRITVNEINAAHINMLVSFDAEISTHTDVLPYVTKAAYECGGCGRLRLAPTDFGLPEPPDSCLLPPDGCGRGGKRFKPAYREELSIVKSVRWLRMTEAIYDEAHKPVAMVLLDEPLARKGGPDTRPYKDGARLRVTGVVRAKLRRRRRDSLIENVHELYVDASSVEPVAYSIVDAEPTAEQVERIRELAKDPEVLDRIAESIAPTIAGLPLIKRAIVLAMFYGNKLALDDGSTVRKNVNLLFVGSPSLAKSQLLHWIEAFYPKSTKMVGRGSSTVSIFGTAVRDEMTGSHFNIVMGLLPRAHNGIFCCDEIDRHIGPERQNEGQFLEALEDRTVTISKGDATVRFDADCPVIAACNWQGDVAPAEMKGGSTLADFLPTALSPTVLSRFIILNVDGEASALNVEETLHRIDARHSPSAATNFTKSFVTPVDPALLRAYVAHARRSVTPDLTKAHDVLGMLHAAFIDYRGKMQPNDRVQLTYRLYEDIKRMAEASARIHLREVPTMEDLGEAMKVVDHTTSFFFGAPLGELIRRGMDIAPVTAGRSADLARDMEAGMRIIESAYEEGGARESVVISRLMMTVGSEDRAKRVLRRLHDEGMTYEPSFGRVRLIKKG